MTTISAQVVADSVAPNGARLTTMLLRYPRVIHAEHLRHRKFSFSVESSRARPFIAKPGAQTLGTLDSVLADPYVPIEWGLDKPGMQPGEKMPESDAAFCANEWLDAMQDIAASSRRCHEKHLAKQWLNRLLEPWSHISVLVSGTDWANFYALRQDSMAMAEMQALANAMRKAHEASVPVKLQAGQWHMPFVSGHEPAFGESMAGSFRTPDRYWIPDPTNPSVGVWDAERIRDELDWRWVSVGRCARLSYLTHLGVRDPVEDMRLGLQCAMNRHPSPLEHVATHEIYEDKFARTVGAYCANYWTWQQLRGFMVNEHPYKPGQVFP